MRNRSSLIVIDVIKESQLEKFVLLYFFLDNKITFIKKKVWFTFTKKVDSRINTILFNRTQLPILHFDYLILCIFWQSFEFVHIYSFRQ